ncbi:MULTISPECIES: hypothetical protein [unclassified Beijerinckia]|uniref:hypothetical protein n=1 Tax=unclassified Beijerinckia TaxID=2638183 RepID=UPI000897C611|nr:MULTISPECIES: hypothetical protein [unclassified Beijerinckia]MDH7794404.1 hypothetical protein [Beijerinckia sp. GAS462]SEB61218.1 hypothetical protein SAMN05443249_0675 [Beijerinckia sp. 28-YEA-48]
MSLNKLPLIKSSLIKSAAIVTLVAAGALSLTGCVPAGPGYGGYSTGYGYGYYGPSPAVYPVYGSGYGYGYYGGYRPIYRPYGGRVYGGGWRGGGWRGGGVVRPAMPSRGAFGGHRHH